MLRPLLIRRIAILALATGLAFGAVGTPIATAAPTLAREEQQGKVLLESVRSGERRCSDLSADDFELIGEYAMGRYLGDEGAHAAMNRRMTLTMGAAGERRMHTALGHRYGGCAGGPAPGWIGAMAGMMGGHGSSDHGPGMMGGGAYEGSSGHYGTTMGFGHHGDADVGVLGVVLIALAAAALGAGVVTLALRGRRPREDTAP
jgi:hypothetical protein